MLLEGACGTGGGVCYRRGRVLLEGRVLQEGACATGGGAIYLHSGVSCAY